MKISESYPSKYLRASDVADIGPREYEIKKVVPERIGETKKPVIYFRKFRYCLPLNKTNAGRLAASLGDETDDWIGQKIWLDVETRRIRGEEVDCITAYVDGAFEEERRPPTERERRRASRDPVDLGDDEIPF